MPRVMRGEHGHVWVDERKTIEEWVAETYGAGARLDGITLSGENIVATITAENPNFPTENVPVHFAPVPDDVTFSLKQGTGGKFVKMYFADREAYGNQVMVKLSDGKNESSHVLDPTPSLAIRRHSPTGFEWGYGGSGPAQLAVAILFDVTGDAEIVECHYQDFKSRFIANLPAGEWKIYDSEVRAWLKNAAEGVLL